MAASAWAVDVYNSKSNVLYIPIVKVGSKYYKNAYITVKDVISVNNTQIESGIDSYDSIANQLKIPLVLVEDQAYSNVSITIDSIIAVEAEIPDATTDCTQVPHKFGDIPIPASYIGSYPVPIATGKLNSMFSRTMDFKDLDAWWSKPNENKCTDKIQYLSNVYIESLNRVKDLGVDTVWIYNYGYWDNFSNPIWKIDPADFAIPKEIMAVIAAEAKRRNIKVFMSWQMNTSDKASSSWNSLDTETLSAQKLNILMDSFKLHMTDIGRFASTIGISGIAGDLGAFTPQFLKNDPVRRETYILKTIETIDALKNVFKGSIAYGQYGSPLDNRLLSKVDELHLSMFLGGTFTQSPYSVELMRMVSSWPFLFVKNDIESQKATLAYSVPIVWDIYAQSTSDFYLKNGYLEDSFCFSPCAQLSVNTDFSAQAIAIEAALEVINQDTSFTTKGVAITNYWLSDEVTPTPVGGTTSFPNISSSIRNKTAEGIVKKWFAK